MKTARSNLTYQMLGKKFNCVKNPKNNLTATLKGKAIEVDGT